MEDRFSNGEFNGGLKRARMELRTSGGANVPIEPRREGVHSRGYLPHVKREGVHDFVTFRLADAMPKEVLLRFEADRANRIRLLEDKASAGDSKKGEQRNSGRELRRKIERYLDQGAGSCHLRRPEIVRLVSGALRFFDGVRYRLDDWVVMPNHVHVIVCPLPNHLLGEIVKSWKQFTSRRAKAILGLGAEPFWQPESYDHWIRDDAEMERARS